MTAEPLPEAVDADYLTAVLRRSEAFGDARVRNVVVESSRDTIVSRIIRLRLDYDGAADGVPASLILKTGQPGRANRAWPAGRQEVAFYDKVAPAMTDPPVPRCFDAKWDADTDAWHLLLEDLTDSHKVPTSWPLPPTTAQCEAILDALARFHSAWWDDPRLGSVIGRRHDAATAEEYVRNGSIRFARFADLLGEDLAPEQRALYEQFLDAAPRLLERHGSHRNVTITHGDTHVWNFFLPRDPRDGVRLFDWDGWSVGIVSRELAYMMATHWFPDRRRRLEQPLLDHYHSVLLAHGVNGYDRGALGDDYRLSVLMQIMTPVWQMTSDIPPWVWWHHFARIMMAVDDLGCRELLG